MSIVDNDIMIARPSPAPDHSPGGSAQAQGSGGTCPLPAGPTDLTPEWLRAEPESETK